MARVAILLPLIGSVVMLSVRADDLVVTLSAYGVRCVLPPPERHQLQPPRVQRGTWTLAQYSSADIYSFALDVPAPDTTGESPNAFSITYGDQLYCAVAVVPQFLSTLELLSRLLDLQELRRLRSGTAPVMLTYAAQRMIGPAPADEVGIELRDTVARDSIYTLITSAARGSDVVVVFVRSRINPRTDTTWTARYYHQLLAGIKLERFFTHDTVHVVHPGGWAVVLPQSWMGKMLTRSSSTMFFPSSLRADTSWNTVAIQLPYVQIEYSVDSTELSDSALVDYAEHIAAKRGLNVASLSAELHSRYPLLRRFETVGVRRGKEVRTVYLVLPQSRRLATIRLTAWETDMPHIERFLVELVESLQW